jgi:hypothetical protein
MTLQLIIDESISFPKELINPNNKPKVNSTFRTQIDVIRSLLLTILKKQSLSFLQKKPLVKNTKKISTKPTGYLQSLMFWNGWSGK